MNIVMTVDGASLRAARAYIDADEVPEALQCGISYDLLKYPVYLDHLERHTYEEGALRAWVTRNERHPLVAYPLELPAVIKRHAARQKMVRKFRHALFHARLERGEKEEAAKLALENAIVRRRAMRPPAPVVPESQTLKAARHTVAMAEAAAAEGRHQSHIAQRLARQGQHAAERAISGLQAYRFANIAPPFDYTTLLAWPTSLSFWQRGTLAFGSAALAMHPSQANLERLLRACAAASIAPAIALMGKGLLCHLLDGGHIDLARSALKEVPANYRHGDMRYNMTRGSERRHTGPTRPSGQPARLLVEGSDHYEVITRDAGGLRDHIVFDRATGAPRTGTIQRGTGDGRHGWLQTGIGAYAGMLDADGQAAGLGRFESPLGSISGWFQKGTLVHGTRHDTSGPTVTAARASTSGRIGAAYAETMVFEGNMDPTGVPAGLGRVTQLADTPVIRLGLFDGFSAAGPGGLDIGEHRFYGEHAGEKSGDRVAPVFTTLDPASFAVIDLPDTARF